jgi:hypothetical protein
MKLATIFQRGRQQLEEPRAERTPEAEIIPLGRRATRRKVRIHQWKGTTRKTARGRVPHVDLDLGANQRILSFEISERRLESAQGGRALSEWAWTALVETVIEGRP